MAFSQVEEDRELVKKTLEGDTKAYAKLFTKYKDAIYFMILKKVVNRDDAEDLTYNAFDKAFRNIDQYNFDYAFSTWLFRIANNTCIDFLRKYKNNHLSIENSSDIDSDFMIGEESIRSNALNPEEIMIKDQRALLINDLLGKLKPVQKKVLRMRYFNDYAYEEIAEKMNMPIGTVKTLIYRAKANLGELLAQEIAKEEIIKKNKTDG